MKLSIVTVCMNRREHLLATAPRVAAWPHHAEHLIVDWSSREPLRREDLPEDPRVRLVRVEGEERWNLCRAYNFAIARASHPWILKLDADCWPTAAFDPALLLAASAASASPAELDGAVFDAVAPEGRPLAGFEATADAGQGSPDPRCWFGSGPEGRKGQFLIARRLFDAVGGFNELLVGYGFDDKDLQARLLLHSGHEPGPIPVDWLAVIVHGDEERAGQGRALHPGGLEAARGQAAMRATRLANRLVAAHCPWGPHRPASRYVQEAADRWRLDPDTLPLPPAAVAAELEHVRRMTFWGAFLAVPEVQLEVLPFSLFPPARGGHWPVRWWHRLWWHSGRRLLALPVQGLVLGRQGLRGCRPGCRRASRQAS